MPSFVPRRTEIDQNASESSSSNGAEEPSSPLNSLPLDNHYWYPTTPDILELHSAPECNAVIDYIEAFDTFYHEHRPTSDFSSHSYVQLEHTGDETGPKVDGAITTERTTAARPTERLTIPDWQLSQLDPALVPDLVDSRSTDPTGAGLSILNSPLSPVTNNLRRQFEEDAGTTSAADLARSAKKALPASHPGLQRGAADRGKGEKQKWNCPGCGGSFTRQSDLGRHNVTIHEQNHVYICNSDDCLHYCFRRDKMIGHCRKKHETANKFTKKYMTREEVIKFKEQVDEKNAKCKECGQKKPTHRCST